VLLGGDGIDPSLSIFLPESDILSMKTLAAVLATVSEWENLNVQ